MATSLGYKSNCLGLNVGSNSSCACLVKLLNFSETQFPIWKMEKIMTVISYSCDASIEQHVGQIGSR